jgi:mannosyltransferase OCH1-like enzyme
MTNTLHLTQIYISDKEYIPEYIQSSISHVKNLYSNCSHTLYDYELCREFIRKNFSEEVVLAFDMLNPYAYKADLARICIVYILGGWYLDVSLRPMISLNIPDNVELFTFRDYQPITGTSFACTNGIFYSKKGNALLLRYIELILENCRKKYYGINALCPTGPILFGRAIANCGENKNHIFGDVRFLTPMCQITNKAFVLPSGEIFCMFKPSGGGDLTSLGGVGVNNYNNIYNESKVYY